MDCCVHCMQRWQAQKRQTADAGSSAAVPPVDSRQLEQLKAALLRIQQQQHDDRRIPADRLPTEFDLRERQRHEEIRRRQVGKRWCIHRFILDVFTYLPCFLGLLLALVKVINLKNWGLHLYFAIYGDVSLTSWMVASKLCYWPQLWFSRLESWSQDVSRLVFQSLALGLSVGHKLVNEDKQL